MIKNTPKQYVQPDGKALTSKDIVVGGIHQGSQGAEFTVISKSDKTARWVIKFNDDYEHQMTVSTQAILKGSPKNPYRPSVFGVGFVGVGKYTPTLIGETGKKRITPEYRAWTHMLERSYYPQYHERFPSYIGTEVCDEWLNYQTFAEWYTNQTGYNLDWTLDKDLLSQDSKLYSPHTCTLIPSDVNGMLNVGGTANKILDLPPGISINKQGKYQVAIRYQGVRRHVLSFDTLAEAIRYKNHQTDIYLKLILTRYGRYIEPAILDKLKTKLYNSYIIGETEITSYLVGAIDSNLGDNDFDDFEL